MKHTLESFTQSLNQTAPVPCDFKVGDIVTFTNEYDVSFPGLKVIGFGDDTSFQGRFIHLNSSCYWFPVTPQSLTVDLIPQ